MGGGNSKSKEISVNNTANSKKETAQQGAADNAFDNYSGPATKSAAVSNAASPAKSVTSKPSLAQADDQEPDD